MFDSLVESSGRKKRGRTGLFFLITSLIYVVILTSFAVLTILWFNPNLADALDVTTMVAPPPPPAAAPPPAATTQVVMKNAPVQSELVAPKEPPKEIPKASEVQSRPVVAAVTGGVPGGVPGGVQGGVPGGIPGGFGAGEPPPPPPPPPSPPPSPTPTPTPKPTPTTLKQSGGVIQGNAISKPAPVYPQIAKAAKISGPVQVKVLISEDGRVIEAEVVSGHQLLRDAALQAAKQWKFRPTELTGVPVKVEGILTFNFTLQ